MSAADRSTPSPRARHILLGFLLAFGALVAAANPLGRWLEAQGVSRGSIGLLLMALVVALFGALAWFVTRTSRRTTVAVGSTLVSMFAAPGLAPADPPAVTPAILQQPRMQSCVPLVAATTSVTGRPAMVTAWRRRFRNLGALVSPTTHSMTLEIVGVRPDARIALGKIGGSAAPAGYMISGLRWSGLPPAILAQTRPEYPWGLGRTALWPSDNVPADPEAWADVAAELDAIAGWVLLYDGRLEIATNMIVPVQRLADLAARVIRVSSV